MFSLHSYGMLKKKRSESESHLVFIEIVSFLYEPALFQRTFFLRKILFFFGKGYVSM